jgi:hypothetical protein
MTTLLVSALLLTACASTNDYDHDPDEQQLLGRVLSKYDGKKRSNIGRGIAEGLVVLPVFIISGGNIILGGPSSGGERYPIQYQVLLESGKILEFTHYYTGFNVGDCVTVFLSENIERYPPRIAPATTDDCYLLEIPEAIQGQKN